MYLPDSVGHIDKPLKIGRRNLVFAADHSKAVFAIARRNLHSLKGAAQTHFPGLDSLALETSCLPC
jgi:hypothetical protein